MRRRIIFRRTRIYCTDITKRRRRAVKKLSAMVGAGVLCIGLGILLASFLPPVVLVCIEAALLILAGLLAMRGI